MIYPDNTPPSTVKALVTPVTHGTQALAHTGAGNFVYVLVLIAIVALVLGFAVLALTAEARSKAARGR